MNLACLHCAVGVICATVFVAGCTICCGDTFDYPISIMKDSLEKIAAQRAEQA